MGASDRIIEICKKKKIRNLDLIAAGCGSSQTVSHVMTGRQKPNIQFIEALLRAYPDIDPRVIFDTDERQNQLNEGRVKYGYCKECIKKDGIIEHLMEIINKKNQRIEELAGKCAQLGEQILQANARHKAG